MKMLSTIVLMLVMTLTTQGMFTVATTSLIHLIVQYIDESKRVISNRYTVHGFETPYLC